ncbi:hypothetical protein FHT87_001676 [Rhizobium sp. BK316]|uniref:hypothetical protein n=1 Tax=Rhizobium sp. BK316 TaxID=2587053 RepID=UPI00161454B7|nr:hypothetical protein [Rhizobium sp. BK316]MBB3407776.1 hypothetical protein [Rhizobium sp. BK316]
MASKRTTGSAAALVVVESIQTAVLTFDAASAKPGTRQWPVILIVRRNRKIVHTRASKVPMVEMKRRPVRFEPARRVGEHP